VTGTSWRAEGWEGDRISCVAFLVEVEVGALVAELVG